MKRLNGKKKACPKCGKEFPLSFEYWYRTPTTRDGYRGWCKKCTNISNEKWQKKNPEKVKIIQARKRAKNKNPIARKKSDLKYKYGLSWEGYEKLLKKQDYCCAVCGRSQDTFTRRLCVDHNHKTGHIRGLLCNFCNGKLGEFLRDNRKRWVGMGIYALKAVREDKKWSK